MHAQRARACRQANYARFAEMTSADEEDTLSDVVGEGPPVSRHGPWSTLPTLAPAV